MHAVELHRDARASPAPVPNQYHLLMHLYGMYAVCCLLLAIVPHRHKMPHAPGSQLPARSGKADAGRVQRSGPPLTDAAGEDSLRLWRDSLATWAIPPEILAQAPESPWQLPRELFARRADAQIERRAGISLRRAEEALEPGGSVLDVGAGSGAASLPLAGRAASLVAVDTDPGMLEELRKRAIALGLQVTLIPGRWPDVADQTPVVDVAVCSHVLYNVPDLAPFVEALTRHTRRRVVIEITAHHPLAGLNPLWRRFHQVERPKRPTWEDAARAIAALGLQPAVERHRRTDEPPLTESYDAVVALTRRRLCLPRARDDEVAAALRDIGFDPEAPDTWSIRDPELVTFSWAPADAGQAM